MAKTDIYDVQNILLPLKNKIGAIQKVENLINEMTHPNIDWKFIVTGIRSYLFDYIYDTIPYYDLVLPVIFHYLREATIRKRGSALRASDTFFDRYIFILRSIGAGRDEFLKLKPPFEEFAIEYLDLMIRESEDGFYFENVNERVLNFGNIILKGDANPDVLIRRVYAFLYLQFEIYIERSITTSDDEIGELKNIIGGVNGKNRELFELLSSVSSNSYNKRIENIESFGRTRPEEIFNPDRNIIDFSHNSSVWERICPIVKKSIREKSIEDDNAILKALEYLGEKSNQGSDRNLQLFISKSLASICSVLVTIGKIGLLKDVVNIVMPELINEIEKEGNYFSAFATIYNIGETVLKSGKLDIIDHFVDILVKSKFCFPEFSGIASDWSVIVNSSHLENIRTWMRLIEIDPSAMRKLVASLIVNLKLGGVFLKDTDVFQRDISRLLNSNYKDIFYLVVSLTTVFPAFYHDIGATGNIRAFTEKIDTNHQMNDLVHFLRKQVHVESSSRTVLLIQRTMEFWMTGDKSTLMNIVPKEVYDNLENSFRLINFDIDEVPKRICNEARHLFPEFSDKKFWDFLNAVGKKRFLEFLNKHDFEGLEIEDKEAAIRYFTEYFNTQIPTEMTKMLHHIKNIFGIDISKTKIWKFLYDISDEEFRRLFEDVSKRDISKVNIEKFITFLHVYRMIYDKYNFSDIRSIDKIEQYAGEGLFAPPENFFERLKSDNIFESLEILLDLQHSLKWDILLSEKEYEPVDTIEFKRHIAFGIPSMYGYYKEKKFDTLKVFLHTNIIRERFFETIVESLNVFPHEIVKYDRVKDVIKLFYRTFLIDGLGNQEMGIVINLLDTPNLKISQMRDIITHLLTIHGEVSDRFNETYKDVCKEAVCNIGLNRISEDYIPSNQQENIEVIVDRFLRSQIMQYPLLQLFDNLLIRLKDYLDSDIDIKGDIVCLNQVDIRIEKGPILYEMKRFSKEPGDGELFAPVWEVGSKAYQLIVAANVDGINVPDGVIISSEFYKRIKDGNINNPRFKRKLVYFLKKYIDEFTQGRFGKPGNPVLLSVRSGAVFSMPGIMDTITNVGTTQEIIDFYSKKDSWFAYDCFRRIIQDLAISYYDMDRKIFEDIMREAKDEAGVDLKEKLTGKQMEMLTKKYRYTLNKAGFSIPKDPYDQLLDSVKAVFQSWESDVAKNYREYVNISDEWGTSVIVQKMVFGNLSPMSITGVVHSHYLEHRHIGLFGEYKTRAQGHDIVSGVAKVFPISEEQKKKYAKLDRFLSLEKAYPQIYKMVFDTVKVIRDRWGNEVEIEFTVEDGALYILQVRGLANHIFGIEELEENPDNLQDSLLGQGLAASGGAVSGRVVFDIDRINMCRKRFKGDKIILIRPETNPEDVIGLKQSDGILTCVGGMTSHAVLQMRRLEKSGVSDFSIMNIDESNNMAIVNMESDRHGKVIIREGDFLTIDGFTGYVYLGYHRTRKKRL